MMLIMIHLKILSIVQIIFYQKLGYLFNDHLKT